MFTFVKQLLMSFVYCLKPGRNLFRAIIVLTIIALSAVVWADIRWLWYSFLVLIIFAMLWDLLRLYGIKSLRAERQVPGKMSLGLWHDIKLTIHYEAGRLSAKQLQIQVFDHYPVSCDYCDLAQTIGIQSAHWSALKYQIKPLKRGNEHFSGVQCLIQSPWSLWLKNHFIKLPSTTMVYPNFAAISQYSLLATEHHLSQLGIRKIRRRGAGMDFNQLREYREGDSIKQIDWKATSRLRKLISREYQDEKDQEIIFLLDCGRRMLSHDGELSHFDHSLNAMLLLSYVALHQGDAVGFSTFATADEQQTQRYLPAKKGMATIQSLLNHVYDLHASAVTPDYAQAVMQLLQRQKKRALIIVLTNLRDEDSHELMQALQLLKGKHLLIIASLKEQLLEQLMSKKVYSFDDALIKSATYDYQNQRQKIFDKLYVHGINYLDVTPDKLAVRLVNRYLDIKSSGQL